MELTSTIRSALWTKAVIPFIKWNFSVEGNYVLDPLSVIVVLASNASKPVGTKLSITQGKLSLHDTSVIQGTVRTFYGDSKTNIKLLHYPIIYACKHFLKRSTITPDIIYLFQKARVGLDNLKHTYRDDREVRACLNTFTNIIHSCFEGGSGTEFLDMLLRLNAPEIAFHEETLPPAISSSAPNSSGGGISRGAGAGAGTAGTISIHEKKKRSQSEGSEADMKSSLFDTLHASWDSNRISIAISIIRELDVATPYGRDNLFVALDAFMQTIHEKTKQVCDALLTSHAI